MRRPSLTSRDIDVINFIDDNNLIMTSDQIARMFYCQSGNMQSALVIARRRLTLMTDLKQIKRCRDYQSQSYLYHMMKKAPRNSDHKLLISETLVTLYEAGFELDYVKTEWDKLEEEYNIRPDIYTHVTYNDKSYILLIECDRTKDFTNGFNYVKIVETWGQDEDLHRIFESKPIVVSVCDRKPEPTNYKFKGQSKSWKPIWVRTDFSNINNLINGLPIIWEG